jgi:osmotically-inducible protein OsmY
MLNARTLAIASLALVSMSGCATYDAYRHCGRGCPPDAQIDTRVRAQLALYPALSAPNQVYVQSLDRVVYLSGQVGTELQRSTAESAAAGVAGVRLVVDNISIGYQGR